MTALELLEEKLNEIKSSSTDMNGTIKFLEIEFKELFKQSKEMEKEQIIDARITAPSEVVSYSEIICLKEAEQYYNETFKNK